MRLAAALWDHLSMKLRVVGLMLAALALLESCGHAAPQGAKTSTATPITTTAKLTTVSSPARADTAPTAPGAAVAISGAATTRPGSTTAGTGTGAGGGRGTTTTGVTARAATAPATSHRAPRATVAPWVLKSPQPAPSLAAWALLDAWAGGNRSAALADATPSAVTSLFAYRYPAGGLQYRGCSSPPDNTPSNCVYRAANDLLSLTVSFFPQGWAVTGAVLES